MYWLKMSYRLPYLSNLIPLLHPHQNSTHGVYRPVFTFQCLSSLIVCVARSHRCFLDLVQLLPFGIDNHVLNYFQLFEHFQGTAYLVAGLPAIRSWILTYTQDFLYSRTRCLSLPTVVSTRMATPLVLTPR